MAGPERGARVYLWSVVVTLGARTREVGGLTFWLTSTMDTVVASELREMMLERARFDRCGGKLTRQIPR